MKKWNLVINMRVLLRLLCVAACIMMIVPTAQAQEPSFSVEINKGRLVRLPARASTVVVADPEVADVQVVSPQMVYVSGRRVGETSILALGANEQVVMEGTVSVSHNLSHLKNLLQRNFPNASIDFDSIGDGLLLKGEVETPGMAEKVQRIAAGFLGDNENIINMMQTREGDQVLLKVKVAEVSRTELKRFGINLENLLSVDNFTFGFANGRDIILDATGTVIRQPDTGAVYGGFRSGRANLNAVIDALEDDGLVSILAEPNLTTKSGVTANFLAGGEFPIPVVGEEDSVTIEYRRFGVNLDFTPTVLSSQKISLAVSPEVSSLTSANSVTTNGFVIPTLLTRRATTTVELGSGESFAIAGLLRRDHGNDINKFPGLGDIPVIGTLFRSNEYRNEQTELVIIVTPYLVKGVNESQLSVPTDGYRPASDLQRILLGRLYDSSTPVDDEPSEPMPRLHGPAGFILR